MRLNINLVLFSILFILLLIFTRFYNLDRTARFLWDESSDLVKMHQYYTEKRFSLVGPVTEDGTRVYSSLVYYMFMPFAILENFDPISPVYGAAFWGIVTTLLLIYLAYKLNKKLTIPTAVLTLLWYPLLETSRWAWNPNLIPLWTILGIIFFLKSTKLTYFLSGFFFGLMIHQHYLSIIPVGVFILIMFLNQVENKDFIKAFLAVIGVFLTLLPFIIFDLKHPPGLFLTRFLYFNNVATIDSLATIIKNESTWIGYMLNFYTQSKILSVLLGLFTIGLLLTDLKNKSKALIFAITWIAHLIGLIFVYNGGSIYYYYVLPSTIFYLSWIIYKRSDLGTFLSYSLIAVLIISGLFSIVPQLNKITWQSDIQSTRTITNLIANQITQNDLKNVNLAVLSSPDNNRYGRKYRDLLLNKGITLQTVYEYPLADNLFVVTFADEKSIRSDISYELNNFRYGPIKAQFKIPQSNWNLYLFQKNPN